MDWKDFDWQLENYKERPDGMTDDTIRITLPVSSEALNDLIKEVFHHGI